MSIYTDTADDFVAEVPAHPILDRISVNAGAAPGGSVVTVRGSFTPGDSTAYVNCDATAGSLLSMLPMMVRSRDAMISAAPLPCPLPPVAGCHACRNPTLEYYLGANAADAVGHRRTSVLPTGTGV